MSRSTLRLSSPGLFGALVMLVGTLLPATGRGQSSAGDDMAAESWGIVGQMLGESVQAHSDLVRATAATTARIVAARERFANAPEGNATDAAWKELETLLNSKDELYLYFAVLHGLEQPAASEMFRRRGSVSVMALGADIDGGIPGPGRQVFSMTVKDIRDELKKMGCQVKGLDVLLFLPAQFREAMNKCKERWSFYELVRNRAEYAAAGKRLPQLDDPRTFVMFALQTERDLDAAWAVKDYEALVSAIGQEKLHQTAKTVAQAQQDARGYLTDEALAQLGLISSTDLPKETELAKGKTADGKMVVWGVRPLAVLRGLWSQDNPQIAAMFAMATARQLTYTTAWQRLQRIEAAVGRQRFESALMGFHAAPRRAGNGDLVTPVPPGDKVWMYRPFEKFETALLAGDDTKTQVRYFIAIDPDTTDAAAVDVKYAELAKLKGEEELLASAQKLRADGWKTESAGEPTGRVVRALGRMLGLRGAPNPHYTQWASFGPGTTATYELRWYGSAAVAHGTGVPRVAHVKGEVTVVASTPDEILLRVTETVRTQTGKWEAKRAGPSRRGEPAREADPPRTERIAAYQDPYAREVNPASMPFVPAGWWIRSDDIAPEIQSQSRASIAIDEEVFDCTRSVWRGPAAANPAASGGVRTEDIAEVWSHPNVPGFVTKAVRNRPPDPDGRGDKRLELFLVTFEAKPPIPAAVEQAKRGEPLAWMRPTDELANVPVDQKSLKQMDIASRSWLQSPVGARVTHRYECNWQGKPVNATVVQTVLEREDDTTRVRLVWEEDGEALMNTITEFGPAYAGQDFLGIMMSLIASNRGRAAPIDIAGWEPTPCIITVSGQSLEAQAYHHIQLPPGRVRWLEQLILSDAVPGGIVHLAVRHNVFSLDGDRFAYTINGLDVSSLPPEPKLDHKPEGGQFAFQQELMVDRHGNGKWERGKILRFEQLPKNAGGKYLIQIGRNPTWHEEDWLREHSRPVADEPETAPAAAASTGPAQAPSSPRQSPPARREKPAPLPSDANGGDSPGGSFAVGSKVQFESRGTLLEGTVTRVRGEGRSQALLVEYHDPGRERTRQIWVRASSAKKLP